MKKIKVHEWIPVLVKQWLHFDLPVGTLANSDYEQALHWLQEATQDIEQTETIMRAVLKQAWTARESSEWVLQELAFEAALVGGGDRRQLARLHLSRAFSGDTALDLYNLRLSRVEALAL